MSGLRLFIFKSEAGLIRWHIQFCFILFGQGACVTWRAPRNSSGSPSFGVTDPLIGDGSLTALGVAQELTVPCTLASFFPHFPSFQPWLCLLSPPLHRPTPRTLGGLSSPCPAPTCPLSLFLGLAGITRSLPGCLPLGSLPSMPFISDQFFPHFPVPIYLPKMLICDGLLLFSSS